MGEMILDTLLYGIFFALYGSAEHRKGVPK